MTLLRCSLCAAHTAEQVQTIIGMFERAGKKAGLFEARTLPRAPVICVAPGSAFVSNAALKRACGAVGCAAGFNL
jgi:ribosomal protein S12 methylthiotransferase accessory factor YcaO